VLPLCGLWFLDEFELDRREFLKEVVGVLFGKFDQVFFLNLEFLSLTIIDTFGTFLACMLNKVLLEDVRSF
jgi:hypothetical protein